MIKHEQEALAAIGRLIAEHRHRAGLSQEALAERTGLHRAYIGSVERGGRNLTIASLAVVARGVGCKPSELLAAAGL